MKSFFCRLCILFSLVFGMTVCSKEVGRAHESPVGSLGIVWCYRSSPNPIISMVFRTDGVVSVGDEIIQIDGIPSRVLSEEDLFSILLPPIGKDVHLVIRSVQNANASTRKVTLTAKNYCCPEEQILFKTRKQIVAPVMGVESVSLPYELRFLAEREPAIVIIERSRIDSSNKLMMLIERAKMTLRGHSLEVDQRKIQLKRLIDNPYRYGKFFHSTGYSSSFVFIPAGRSFITRNDIISGDDRTGSAVQEKLLLFLQTCGRSKVNDLDFCSR